MGGGGFLIQLAVSGQTLPLVVARGECAVLRNQSYRNGHHTLRWGPRHPMFGVS